MAELSSAMFDHLQRAFAAEAATTQRYAYFSQIAEIEGHPEIAKIFDQLGESMAVAAHGHLDFLKPAGGPSTALNLAAALAGELDEAARLYPSLAEAAHGEGLADVGSWLETLIALKRAHAAKLEQALRGLRPRASALEPA